MYCMVRWSDLNLKDRKPQIANSDLVSIETMVSEYPHFMNLSVPSGTLT